MRVLVTGGSSLIGTGVASALIARGDSVVSLQRTRSDGLAAIDVEQHLGDIRESDTVVAAAAGCDAVVHLAAKVGVIGRWDEYRSINVGGTDNVLAAVREQGIAKLVHVSSPSVAHGGEPIIGGRAEAPVLGRSHSWYPESKAIAEIRAIDAASSTKIELARAYLEIGDVEGARSMLEEVAVNGSAPAKAMAQRIIGELG